MTVQLVSDEPQLVEKQGLEILLFFNKLPADFDSIVGMLHAGRSFATDLGSGLTLPTYGFMNRYIEDHVVPGLASLGYVSSDLDRLEEVMREAISNDIRHPLKKGLPYRPIVSTFLLEGEDSLVWTEVACPNPFFDPRTVKWQANFDPERLKESTGRSILYMKLFGDFAAYVRRDKGLWTSFSAVSLTR